MLIGVPKEIKNNEFRIGLTPKSTKVLTQQNHEVHVEKSAGLGSGFTDEDYLNAGAKIIEKSQNLFSKFYLQWKYLWVIPDDIIHLFSDEG